MISDPTISLWPFTDQARCPLTLEVRNTVIRAQSIAERALMGQQSKSWVWSQETWVLVPPPLGPKNKRSFCASWPPSVEVCRMAVLAMFKLPQFQRAQEATTNQPVQGTLSLVGLFANKLYTTPATNQSDSPEAQLGELTIPS